MAADPQALFILSMREGLLIGWAGPPVSPGNPLASAACSKIIIYVTTPGFFEVSSRFETQVLKHFLS